MKIYVVAAHPRVDHLACVRAGVKNGTARNEFPSTVVVNVPPRAAAAAAEYASANARWEAWFACVGGGALAGQISRALSNRVENRNFSLSNDPFFLYIVFVFLGLGGTVREQVWENACVRLDLLKHQLGLFRSQSCRPCEPACLPHRPFVSLQRRHRRGLLRERRIERRRQSPGLLPAPCQPHRVGHRETGEAGGWGGRHTAKPAVGARLFGA